MVVVMRMLVASSLIATSLVATSLLAATTAQAASPAIVAAENFYGDIALQVAGPDAVVTSILSNPDQDPHLFEASPSVARSLADARIVVANGIGYDPWIDKLLGASPAPGRVVITAAMLMHKHDGDNPHLWYDPATMPAVARAVAAALTTADPAHAAEIADRLRSVLASFAPIDARVAALHSRLAGIPVTATEPVFGLMASALGLVVRNERFARAVMNDTEPSASDVAAFERDLVLHRVKLFLYNSQTSNAAAKRLMRIARESGVPVVGVTETEPPGTSYQQWMLTQLDAVTAALTRP